MELKIQILFLIGSNPRYEATILNARIRKAYLQNRMQIVSLNDVGDLTYPYRPLNGEIQKIKDITDDNHEISNLITNAKRPMIIFGQSVFKSHNARSIFETLKSYLIKKGKYLMSGIH